MDGDKATQNLENVRNTQRFVNRDKAVKAVSTILDAEANFDLLVDMQDRRVRNLLTDKDRLHPVFCFNRIVGAEGRILWPLPIYQDARSEDFLGNLNPCRVPWSEKKDLVSWRGIMGGRANPKGNVLHERIRLKPLINKLRSGGISEKRGNILLSTFPRHRFVQRYHSDPRFDVGFVDGNGFRLRDEPLFSHLERPRIERADFQNYKYIAVLRGLDIGSSFYWTMNSGSLGLVMETPFESFASCHFKPWLHYVPFREDLSDFEEKLDWCKDNQESCQIMVAAATEMCQWLAREDIRHEVSKGVIEALRASAKHSSLPG